MTSPRAVAKLLDEAMERHRAGEFAQAKALYLRIVAKDPTNANGWYLLSVLAMRDRRYDEAAELVTRAIRYEPTNAMFHSNLGECYRRLGRNPEAIVAFRNSITAKPDLAEAHYNLGLVLDAQGQLADALRSYETARRLKPALLDLVAVPFVNALSDEGRFEEAIQTFNEWSARVPASAELHRAVAVALASIFRYDEARTQFRRALELDPTSSETHAFYGGALLDSACIDEAIREFRRALELKADDHVAHSNLIFALSFHSGYGARAQSDEARLWGRKHTPGVPRAPHHQNSPDPERRLRIGYVSPDLRRHSVAHFVLPLFRLHDREKVEVYAYSNSRTVDHVTAQIRGVCDHWRHIAPLSDAAALKIIQDDQIDILVDLAMHSGNNRLLLFAHKPAPVQLTWLAYAGTTGLDAMDYRVTDPWFDPPTADETLFTEAPLRLPETFWCYDPLTDEPAVNALPALASGHVTLGCLNHFRKIGPATVALFAQALHAVSGSRILLVAPLGDARTELVRRFEAVGVDGGRIEFVLHCARADYLALYHRIDCGLDPLPFNGGTTSLDAFWMGVPVVTAVGETVVGRGGLSLCRNLGLPELVADSPEKFGEVVFELCSDLGRLSTLRRSLRARLEASPLMDGPRFATHLEAAYRSIWRRWCAGAATSPSTHPDRGADGTRPHP